MITMLDSIDINQLPAGPFAYAGYVGGKWPTYVPLRRKYPDADVLSIAVNASQDADCLDIEQFDATPDQAAAWVLRQYARGVKRPCLYASVSVMDRIMSAVQAAGIDRYSLRLWSAHYGAGQHICGPSTCKLMSHVPDGTQWTDRWNGTDADASSVNDFFFDDVDPWQVKMMEQLPYVKLGNKDSDFDHMFVTRIQLILSGVFGFYTGTVDGVFGVTTSAAVKKLQADPRYSLAVDGIVGPNTWKVLYAGSI